VSRSNHVVDEVIHLSVSLIDRYLSRNRTTKTTDLLKIGLAALVVSFLEDLVSSLVTFSLVFSFFPSCLWVVLDCS
jgi:hypothetical protein